MPNKTKRGKPDPAAAKARAPYDVPAPLDAPKGTGWMFWRDAVTKGKFSPGTHTPDLSSPDYVRQGRGGPWYETEADVLKARRNVLAEEAFATLAYADLAIAEAERRDADREAEATPSPSGP